jgi:hypothetical protein
MPPSGMQLPKVSWLTLPFKVSACHPTTQEAGRDRSAWATKGDTSQKKKKKKRHGVCFLADIEKRNVFKFFTKFFIWSLEVNILPNRYLHWFFFNITYQRN